MISIIAPIDSAWIGRHPLPDGIAEQARIRIGTIGAPGYLADIPGLVDGTTPGCEVFRLQRAESQGDSLTDSPDRDAGAILTDPAADVWIVIDAAAIDASHRDVIRAHDTRAVLIAEPADIARMIGWDENAVDADHAAAAQRAAIEMRALVLLRSEPTVIAHPDGRLLRHEGPAARRVDILAGLIAGFIRRGASPIRAAAWGVWLQGEAHRQLAQEPRAPDAYPREPRIAFIRRS